MVSLIGNDSETPSETASLDLDFFMSSGNGDFLSKDENKGMCKTYLRISVNCCTVIQ